MKKRADGRYCKQITIKTNENGKPQKKNVYGRTIKEVEQKEREIRNLLEKGISVTTDNITVQELIKLWEKEKKKSVSDGTYKNLVGHTKKIIQHIGNMKVIDVKLFNLEALLDEYPNMSASTSNGFIIRIKGLFQYAVRKEIIIKNPADQINYCKKDESTKRMLTNIEKELIDKANFNDWEYCFLHILRYTGIRKGEALALSVSDMDIKNRTLTINKTLTSTSGNPRIKDTTKTQAGIRTIPIFEPLKPILESYCKNRIGLLFPSPTGKLMSNTQFQHTWSRIRNKMAIENNNIEISDDITPHIFRHTFASDLYDAGIDLKRAQYILGHSDIKTTLSVYTHFDKTKLKADDMDNYYKSQSKNSQTKKATS